MDDSALEEELAGLRADVQILQAKISKTQRSEVPFASKLFYGSMITIVSTVLITIALMLFHVANINQTLVSINEEFLIYGNNSEESQNW